MFLNLVSQGSDRDNCHGDDLLYSLVMLKMIYYEGSGMFLTTIVFSHLFFSTLCLLLTTASSATGRAISSGSTTWHSTDTSRSISNPWKKPIPKMRQSCKILSSIPKAQSKKMFCLFALGLKKWSTVQILNSCHTKVILPRWSKKKIT